MNIAELLANEELRRHEFPVAQNQVYLAHAGVSPLPHRVSEAVRGYAEQCTRGDQEMVGAAVHLPRTRELAAQLLNVTPEEIALVGPTSLALSYVAAGLRFRKHDNILVYFDDYPSNVYPWMALAEKGVQVRLLNLRQLGRIRRLDVEGQVDEQTRLVALASCHFLSGWRLEVEALGRFLRERGILFCVDGIQTLGAFPLNAAQVDFLAADAHKWLLGPCAAGLLYVRKEVQPELQPPVYGWNNVLCPGYVARETLEFPNDARRYEAGSANYLGLAGLQVALELLLELGVDNVAVELQRKRAWLAPALQAKGYTILNADAPLLNTGGILTFHRPEADLAALHERLLAAGVVTSLRTDRAGKNYLRLSPHYYNTDAELHRALELL